jgi:hypothetical protein
MPNRIVRDGILTSEKVEQLDDIAGYFYTRLLLTVDDFGRYFANPKLLIAAVYPLRCTSVTVEQIQNRLNQCAKAGLIRIYEIDNKTYLEVINFKQRTRAKKSKFPAKSQNARHMSGICQADDKHMLDNCPSHEHHLSDNGQSNSSKEATVELQNKNARHMSDTRQSHVSHMTARDEDVVEDEVDVFSTKTKNRFCFENTKALVFQKPDKPDKNFQNAQAPPNPAGEICLALKNLGLESVNPSHPELLRLIAQGVPLEAFIEAASISQSKGKGFAYTLGIVKAQASQASEQKALGKWKNSPRQNNPHDQHALIEPI